MTPFDLEAALAGAPVVTRDGRKVTELHLFEADIRHPLAVHIDGIVGITRHRKDGTSDSDTSRYDLFMAVVKREGWVNIYHLFDGTQPGRVIFSTKEEAVAATVIPCVDTVKIEWEE